jgi:hypothetical protein
LAVREEAQPDIPIWYHDKHSWVANNSRELTSIHKVAIVGFPLVLDAKVPTGSSISRCDGPAREVVLPKRLGVPKALGLSVED